MQTPPQAPAPHMNPAFFHQHQQQGPNPGIGMGSPPGPYQSQGPPIDNRSSPVAPAVPDVEFEEIMSRNRTVSSSAISRAVSDAATGLILILNTTNLDLFFIRNFSQSNDFILL